MSPLPSAGPLGIPYLAEFWSRTLARRSGAAPQKASARDWVDDNTLLAGLGLNLRETYAYLYDRTPTLEAFEAWILAINGGSIDPARIARLKAALAADVSGEAALPAPEPAAPPALSDADLAFWDENGYVVLRDAVPPENAQAAAQAISDFLAIDPLNPATCSRPHHLGSPASPPRLVGQSQLPAHSPCLRANLAAFRLVGQRRSGRLQSPRTPRLEFPRPASPLGREPGAAHPVRRSGNPVSDRYRRRSGSLHLRARFS